MPVPTEAGWLRIGAFRDDEDNVTSAWVLYADALAALDGFIAAPGSMPESARLARLRSAMAPITTLFNSQIDLWVADFVRAMLDDRPELATLLPSTIESVMQAHQTRDWYSEDLGI